MVVRRSVKAMQKRPLQFFWVCDVSGSMSIDGKIQSLNSAIKEALPHMKDVAEANPFGSVQIRVSTFSHGAQWQVQKPAPLEDFSWADLEADELVGGRADADIIFLIDTSGSMGGEIEGVKSSCQDFADHIISQGANLRVGLIGFDIGGLRVPNDGSYTVKNLSTYTIGTWPLTDPASFRRDVQSLKLCQFGGGGCYLAESNTVDIFPEVVRAFDSSKDRERILVIVSDEMGGNSGLDSIVNQLKSANITTHVLGVSRTNGAHQAIADRTGGKFWDIMKSKGKQAFEGILEDVAETIGKELSKRLSDGTESQGTDMGAAMRLIAKDLAAASMPNRGFPPVIVLVSDGLPTDDFEVARKELMKLPWAQRAVRIAIGIGKDADPDCLKKFIDHPEIPVLHARNPETLTRFILWSSTVALEAASTPNSQVHSETPSGKPGGHAPAPIPPVIPQEEEDDDVW